MREVMGDGEKFRYFLLGNKKQVKICLFSGGELGRIIQEESSVGEIVGLIYM